MITNQMSQERKEDGMLIEELLNKIQSIKDWAVSIEEQHSVTHKKRQYFIAITNSYVQFQSPVYPDGKKEYSKKITIWGCDEQTEISFEDMRLIVEILDNYKEIIQHWLVEGNIDDTK